MPRRRFELTVGKSAKFWEINQRGKRTTVCFGRIGTNGQTRDKEHESAAVAKKAAASLVAQKLKKGYLEISDAPNASPGAQTKSKSRKRKGCSEKPAITSTASIPRNETLTFIGLVDPAMAGSGDKTGRAKQWTFNASLAVWKIDGGPVVREVLDIIAKKIGDRKLSTLMEQFEKLGLIWFTARRVKRQTRKNVTVELVKCLGEARDKDLSQVKKELSQPIEIQDRTFGTVRYDREKGFFAAEMSHRSEKLFVWFETESIEEAEMMIGLAKPLWRSRVKWFKEFQAFAVDKMFDLAQDWRSQEREFHTDGGPEPLTTDEFFRLVGDPCGLIFDLRDGELTFAMEAGGDDLFDGHGITVEGTLKDGLVDAYMG